MFQLTPVHGNSEKSIPVKNLHLLQYFYGWFMLSKYVWLDMHDAFCRRFSLFRYFAKLKKIVSTSPGLPYV